MKVSYLGPTGTYNEEALLLSSAGAEIELVPQPTIFDAIDTVEQGSVERGLVPFENSIEGPVRQTLDALAFEAPQVRIVGEYDLPIRHHLISREPRDLDEIEVVLSHPQANAQCARFIRAELPGAEVQATASTSEAVRRVSESSEPWAALGSAHAAEVYGCTVLRTGVEDAEDNVTRFVWLAREEDLPASIPGGEAEDAAWRTTLVFAELGDDHPGALVEALGEFASRGVNLTRIESRPLRQGLGRYLFFIDIDGAAESGPVAEAIGALRGKAANVRVLGSYPLGGPAPLGDEADRAPG